MSVQKPRSAFFGLAFVVQFLAILALIVVCIVTIRFSKPVSSGPEIAAISVTNIKNGETLSYPVAMLVGHIELAPAKTADSQDTGDAARSLVIEINNRDHPFPGGAMQGAVIHHQFTLLAPLSPGSNRLLLSIGKTQTPLTLNYRPSVSPYQVRVAYVLPKDGEIRFPGYSPDSKQDYEDKLDVAVKLMQTYTAEEMNRQGLGRKTFNLELDAKGHVVVHTLRFPDGDKAAFRKKSKRAGLELIEMLEPWVEKQFPGAQNRTLVIPAIDGDGGGRGGGAVGVIQAPHLASWPSSLAEVTLPGWQEAHLVDLVEIGMGLHELGHCFGCEHSDEPNSIMSRGAYTLGSAFAPDQENIAHPQWDEYDTAHFYYLRWFQPEAHTYNVGAGPTVRRDDKQGLILDSPNGIGAIDLYTPSNTEDEEAAVYTQRHQILFKTGAPHHMVYTPAQLKSWIGSGVQMNVLVTDTQGNSTFTELDAATATSRPLL